MTAEQLAKAKKKWWSVFIVFSVIVVFFEFKVDFWAARGLLLGLWFVVFAGVGMALEGERDYVE